VRWSVDCGTRSNTRRRSSHRCVLARSFTPAKFAPCACERFCACDLYARQTGCRVSWSFLQTYISHGIIFYYHDSLSLSLPSQYHPVSPALTIPHLFAFTQVLKAATAASSSKSIHPAAHAAAAVCRHLPAIVEFTQACAGGSDDAILSATKQ
jgi:hypothetical protein